MTADGAAPPSPARLDGGEAISGVVAVTGSLLFSAVTDS